MYLKTFSFTLIAITLTALSTLVCQAEITNIDDVLVAINSYSAAVTKAQTTVQRENTITDVVNRAQQKFGSSTIYATVTVKDIRMKNQSTATISFDKVERPSFELIKAKAAFTVDPKWQLDLPMTEDKARTIIPGHKLIIKGTPTFYKVKNSFLNVFDSSALIKLSYKYPITGHISIKFNDAKWGIFSAEDYNQMTRTTTTVKQPAKTPAQTYQQPAKPTNKPYVPQPQIKVSHPSRFTYKQVSFDYPNKWKVSTKQEDNFYKITCKDRDSLFSVTFCKDRYDPEETINAWVNKLHVTTIPRPSIYKTPFLNASINTCDYSPMVNKQVIAANVRIFNTTDGNTIIINKQAETKEMLDGTYNDFSIIENSFKLLKK
ncbi:MAG: hypothetical protein PF692_10260 [Kiritimatiellae bacterium]|jgi:hypothetical protein|nr:hypothetical protein [Kiritimatiellia bacterium]